MTDIYFEPIDDTEISREDVAEERDIATLHTWLTSLQTTEGELCTMLGAVGAAPAAYDTGPMCRRLGYTRIGIGWVKRRLSELGEPVSEPEPSGDKARIAQLRQQITQMNEACERHKRTIRQLRAQLEGAPA